MEKEVKQKILNSNVIELEEMVKNGEITKKQVFDTYLERSKENDEKIGAYVSITKDSEDKIPIAIKDNINVFGTYTTCSSKMLKNYKSPYDATLVKYIKDAGYGIIGKVNMDEFAFGSSTEYSALKITSNPHDLNKVPGGSSGGSAAVVASNEAPWSIGTDTGGSVRQPAAYCGVVGLKPSYGVVSRHGVTSFASSLDQAGTLTKTVEDAAKLLNIISGRNYYSKTEETWYDMDSTVKNPRTLPDFEKLLNDDIKGKKIAVIDEFLKSEMQEEVRLGLENTIDTLKGLGSEVERVKFPFGNEVIAVYHIISSAEASSNLSRMDGVRFGEKVENPETIEDIFVESRTKGFGREAKRRIMLGTYVLSAGYYDAYYKKALKVRQLIIEEMERIFSKYDTVLMPVTIKTAPVKNYVESNQEETYYSDIYTCLANIAALPAISIPVGKDREKMPIGMQLLGNRYEDDKLLNIANILFKNMDNEKIY